uniref:Carnitine O-acetyltransferase n=1 Tax=Cynoglossus semilaevis TaxID=244447 RepID=A0A3P8WNR1_CYNSE
RSHLQQEGLPKLPVPPLRQTCQTYLECLKPLVSTEELGHTQLLVDEFLTGGVGDRLQKGLERRARKTDNWLSEWWMQSAYLDCRMPVPVYTSPGVVLPRMQFHDRQGQMRFAAKVIAGVLDFKKMIDTETLPVEYLSGKPLCMDQYYQILSSCRVPGPRRDTVVNHAIGKTSPTHITVVHNFQFFRLDVYNSDGSPLTVDQLYMQLEKIWNSSLQSNKEPIGILTSQHRNTWGKAYNNLIKDKMNKESVRAIQKSIFTICLDAPIPRVSDGQYWSRVAAQMLHGGGARWNSGNRWFDKTLQFIVGEDGMCGLVYEHAPAEGPPIVFLIDYRTEMVRSPMVPLSMPQKLRFNITPEIKRDIDKAKQNMNMMVNDLDAQVLLMYDTCCSTYESASLRMFKLGRTDVIRATTVDSVKFVRSMQDSTKQVGCRSRNSSLAHFRKNERFNKQKLKRCSSWICYRGLCRGFWDVMFGCRGFDAPEKVGGAAGNQRVRIRAVHTVVTTCCQRTNSNSGPHAVEQVVDSLALQQEHQQFESRFWCC